MKLTNNYQSTTGIVIEKIYDLNDNEAFYITPMFTVNGQLAVSNETRKYFSGLRIEIAKDESPAARNFKRDLVKSLVNELAFLQSHVNADFAGIEQVICRTSAESQGFLSNVNNVDFTPVIPCFDPTIINQCPNFRDYVLNEQDAPLNSPVLVDFSSHQRLNFYKNSEPSIAYDLGVDEMESIAFEVLTSYNEHYCALVEEKISSVLYETTMLINGDMYHNEIRDFSLSGLRPVQNLVNIEPIGTLIY
ncbi:hypothetical protein [Photobacterium leiognathi]|uniref:hypothetical protein n=1 Tax=Photobacterium leiognathi TaxID=553611 RepID=UPI0029827538|nr:hypothetical protein [Photobacterium leiognathi]